MSVERIKNILRATINDQIVKFAQLAQEKWNVKSDWYKEKYTYNYDPDPFYDYTEDSRENKYQHTSKPDNQKSFTDLEIKYYNNLEVSIGASFKEIKESYRKLVRMYHPDFFATSPKKQEMAQKVTLAINEAYQYFEKKHKN